MIAQSRPSKTVLTDQNTVLSSQTYAYDALNRVSGTEMETIGREISYAYDGLNRLMSATGTLGGSNTVSTAYAYKTNNGSQAGRLDSVSYNKTINGVTTQLYPTISYDYDANDYKVFIVKGDKSNEKDPKNPECSAMCGHASDGVPDAWLCSGSRKDACGTKRGDSL